MKAIRNAPKRKSGTLERRDHLGDEDVERRIILKLILEKWVLRVRTGSRDGLVAGSFEHGS
jgi:hypothetical protein